jgi:hypothetical protein
MLRLHCTHRDENRRVDRHLHRDLDAVKMIDWMTITIVIGILIRVVIRMIGLCPICLEAKRPSVAVV